MAPQRIIWIASYPKSGNTWVRAFVHNLISQLKGAGEEPYDINRLHERTAWELVPGRFRELLGKDPRVCATDEIAEARPEIQRRIAQTASGPVFAKTHMGVARVNGHPTINFDVTLAAIYVVRNPLDIAISYASHTMTSIDEVIRNMADSKLCSKPTDKNVYEFIGSWSTNVASWISIADRPVFTVRYEDMLRTPERVFRALAGFLGLAPRPEQLKRAIEGSSFAELSRQEQQRGFNERPAMAEKFFRVGKADQWREVLTKDQIDQIVIAHAPMMQRFGYIVPNSGAGLLAGTRSAADGQRERALAGAVSTVLPISLARVGEPGSAWVQEAAGGRPLPTAPETVLPPQAHAPSMAVEVGVEVTEQGEAAGTPHTIEPRAEIPADPGSGPLIVAYDLNPKMGVKIVPGSRRRGWMDATPQRFANRCLPLLIANQYGWLLLAPCRIRVVWSGGNALDSLKVEYAHGEERRFAASHFGNGILTFSMNFIFRTPRGYNLHVRGPANMPKDGISPLEGIIESDWSEATFTMNWKMTRAHHPIVFEQEEPFATLTPVARGEIERFRGEIRPISDNPALQKGYADWSQSRSTFNAGLRVEGSEARAMGWQRHYVRGETVSHTKAEEHQTGLSLSEFIDRRKT